MDMGFLIRGYIGDCTKTTRGTPMPTLKGPAISLIWTVAHMGITGLIPY